MSEIVFKDQSRITEIGNAAFAGSGILHFTMPSNITTVPPNLFQGSKLVEISVYEDTKLNTVGNAAFANCKSLKNVNLTNCVTYIGANAFEGCPLSFSFLGDFVKLTYIGNSAFRNCGFTTLIIPKSVTSIGISAFENCPSMISVSYEGNSPITEISNSTFAGCKSLCYAYAPNGLAKIGNNAFSGTHLSSFNITNKIITIGSRAFADCTELTIYAAFNGKQVGWASDWNPSNRCVVYGATMAYDTYSYVTSCVKSSNSPDNPTKHTMANPVRYSYDFDGWYTTSNFSGKKYNLITAPNGTLYAKWIKNDDSCIAEGSLITLADGRQVAVEELTGDEQLLVWNLQTGRFDVAPIMFIDSEIRAEYEIIKLRFADGTVVKVIDEHGFWDVDLNRYVYLRNDAAKYIGHRFNKQTVDGEGNMIWTSVKLVGVDVYKEVTTAWSPVTSGHLCYYVNGMLSMPGGIEGLFNIFEVDGDAMKYDEEAFAEDIETYGLFSYEEFAALVPVSQEVFEAFGGQYLKIAIGKGLITVDKLNALAERYAKYF